MTPAPHLVPLPRGSRELSLICNKALLRYLFAFGRRSAMPICSRRCQRRPQCEVCNWRGLQRFALPGIVRAMADPQGRHSAVRIEDVSWSLRVSGRRTLGWACEPMIGVNIDFTGSCGNPALWRVAAWSDAESNRASRGVLRQPVFRTGALTCRYLAQA
jgi:hypothetical protein